MCGIAGILSVAGTRVDPSLVRAMTNAIRHRGPDDEGFVLADSRTGTSEHRRGADTIPEIRVPDVEAPFTGGTPTVALGWRRLSIIDLSPTGHQPMTDHDGSLWLVFNGEVYNYIELREELRGKGHAFRTSSDTEVVLAAYRQWGADCLRRFNGMWGLAIWDARKKELFCARDRFGVKPFTYVWDGSTFAFASEIKALLELPWVAREANDAMVYDFLVHRVLDHTDQTFFKAVRQLPPGHCATVSPAGLKVERWYELHVNPDLGRFVESEAARHAAGFRELLTDAVRLRLRADVTVGSCLSGGIDSSSIVCLANDLLRGKGGGQSPGAAERQKTFTASYDLSKYSEDNFVRMVIEKTGAQAHFIKPTDEQLWSELGALVRANDEPFNSTSLFAQWNVMKLAAEHGVTVLLDGQGSDELLAGYRPWHFPVFHAELLRSGRVSEFYRESVKAAALAGEPVSAHLLRALQKFGKNAIPARFHAGAMVPSRFLSGELRDWRSSTVRKLDTSIQSRLHQDETQYNLQQLLHYEDRTSMHFSIEARVPFVDYRLVESAMALPAVYKIHDGWSKYILRRAMEGILPPEIQWRRDKMGFVTPEAEWLTALMPRLVGLLEREPFRAVRYLDHQRFIAELRGGLGTLKSMDVWRFMTLELWMRSFKVA